MDNLYVRSVETGKTGRPKNGSADIIAAGEDCTFIRNHNGQIKIGKTRYFGI
jgi:hypothetical protein